MSFTSSLVSAAVLFAGSAAAADHAMHDDLQTAQAGGCKPLRGLIADEQSLSHLSALLDDAVLPLPKPDRKLTIFAPVDAALEAFLATPAHSDLVADADAARKLLDGHIVLDGGIRAAGLSDGMTLHTAAATLLTVHASDEDGVVVTAPAGGSSAVVLTPDLVACDAVVHLIDAVLLPGDVAPEIAVLPVDETLPIDMDADPSKQAGVITRTPGTYGDVALEPPVMEETSPSGLYGDDEAAAMYGAYGDEMAADDLSARGAGAGAGDEDSDSLEIDADSSSAGVVVAGAVVAGTVAVLAGVAGVVYSKKRAAAAASVAGSTGLSGRI